MNIDIYSWNVNGYRAILKKDVAGIITANTLNASILALQESRVHPSQLTPSELPKQGIWNHLEWSPSCTRQGYSGVTVLSTLKAITIKKELPVEELAKEGRLLHVEYEHFHLLNCYFPNGQNGEERLSFKMAYYDHFLQYAESLRAKKPVIALGDFNTAHTPIDLSHPKQNEKESGFLPIERAWIDSFIQHGYIDTFRYFYPDATECYTWWSYKTRARERNIGWRIDYIFISQELLPYLTRAWIASDIFGSDHCPVAITLTL